MADSQNMTTLQAISTFCSPTLYIEFAMQKYNSTGKLYIQQMLAIKT